MTASAPQASDVQTGVEAEPVGLLRHRDRPDRVVVAELHPELHPGRSYETADYDRPVRQRFSAGGWGPARRALARAGRDVVLLLRPETLARTRAGSASRAPCSATSRPRSSSPRSSSARSTSSGSRRRRLSSRRRSSSPAGAGRAAVVVPLLNGIDHVARLRESYERVLAPRSGSSRSASSPARAPADAVRPRRPRPGPGRRGRRGARAAGSRSRSGDEPTVLWEKLAPSRPRATTRPRAPPGGAGRGVERPPLRPRSGRRRRRRGDLDAGARGAPGTPGRDATSMQKDFDAGRPLELDAIAARSSRGPPARARDAATEELIRLVEQRLSR